VRDLWRGLGHVRLGAVGVAMMRCTCKVGYAPHSQIDYIEYCPMHEAAPALVDALGSAYEKIRAYQKEYGNKYAGGPLLQNLVPQIEAALALAKGEKL
jgi:hypothetical protein